MHKCLHLRKLCSVLRRSATSQKNGCCEPAPKSGLGRTQALGGIECLAASSLVRTCLSIYEASSTLQITQVIKRRRGWDSSSSSFARDVEAHRFLALHLELDDRLGVRFLTLASVTGRTLIFNLDSMRRANKDSRMATSKVLLPKFLRWQFDPDLFKVGLEVWRMMTDKMDHCADSICRSRCGPEPGD